MKVQLFCLLFCKNIILVKTVVIKKIYFVTPFAHDHNTWVRNKSTTFVFIEQKPFQWNIRRGEGYFVETLLQRQNERTGFIGSSKSPNDGAIRSEICLITWSMIILFDVWLVWPWLDFSTLIRLGPLWLRWESNLPSLTMSIPWEKTRIRLARA